MTDDQIKHMTQRFLMWKLPEHFSPDAGIRFKAEYNDSPAAMAALGIDKPMRHEPVGTNLFSAAQAEEMIRHMVDGMAAPAHNSVERVMMSELGEAAADCMQMVDECGGNVLDLLVLGEDKAKLALVAKTLHDVRERLKYALACEARKQPA